MLKAKQVGCPIISLYRDIEILSSHSGGWWYKICANTNLTGQHTKTRSKIGGKQIFYYYGGKRGKGVDSWSEVNMLLLPNWASFPSLFFIWSVQIYHENEHEAIVKSFNHLVKAWLLVDFSDKLCLLLIFKLSLFSCHALPLILITKQLFQAIESYLMWCDMKTAFSKLSHFWDKCSNIIHISH